MLMSDQVPSPTHIHKYATMYTGFSVHTHAYSRPLYKTCILYMCAQARLFNPKFRMGVCWQTRMLLIPPPARRSSSELWPHGIGPAAAHVFVAAESAFRPDCSKFTTSTRMYLRLRPKIPNFRPLQVHELYYNICSLEKNSSPTGNDSTKRIVPTIVTDTPNYK